MDGIYIDINPVIQELQLSDEEINSLGRMLLDRVADVYMQKWEQLVDKNLHSTRQDYKAGMDFRYTSDLSASFVLEGKERSRLGLMIEEGASPFDIKKGMENSSKKTVKKDGGWDITVPFRHSTPEAIGEAAIFSSKLPERVYSVAKENKGAAVQKEQLPSENQKLEIRPEIKTDEGIIPSYEHKSPIYQGLVKTTKKNHETYHTFRRISNNSDKNSWIHKGFTPHKFMEKALQEIENEIPEIIGTVKEEFFELKFNY